jgi:hypothetical protein
MVRNDDVLTGSLERPPTTTGSNCISAAPYPLTRRRPFTSIALANTASGGSGNGEYVKRDRGFESISLQQRVMCEPSVRARAPHWRPRRYRAVPCRCLYQGAEGVRRRQSGPIRHSRRGCRENRRRFAGDLWSAAIDPSETNGRFRRFAAIFEG